MRKDILLASALALAGCGDSNFNRPDLLTQPRILAIQAEPPQPPVGTSTTLRALLYQPPVTGDGGACPDPSAAPTYTWSWCPWPTNANNDYACPIAQTDFDQLYPALGLGQAPSLNLGAGETASFTNPFPASLLYALCRGDIGLPLAASAGNPDGGNQSSLFQCDLPSGENTSTPPAETHPIGFPVMIYLTVTPPCPSLLPAGFSPLAAVFVVHLPTNDALPGNLNPTMNGIFVTSPLPNGELPSYDASPVPQDGTDVLDDAIAPDDGGVFLPDGAAGTTGPAGVEAGAPSPAMVGWKLDDRGSVLIPRQQHVSIQLGISLDSSELMAEPGTLDDVFDSNGNLLGTRHFERLDFAWFAEAGDFGNEDQGGRNTGYLPNIPDSPATPSVRAGADQVAFDAATSNVWTLPFSVDYPPSTSHIIVVVRDSRGGVAWTSGVATLQDRP